MRRAVMGNGFSSKPCAAVLLVLLLSFCAHAVEYDVSYQGAIETVNGVIYQQWDEPTPMGTGVIGGFLQIQGEPELPQHGYNTNGAIEFDTKTGCRTLLLSEIPIVEFGGTGYREFLLDINQTLTHQILSLDKFNIFLETTDSISGYPGNFSTAIYDIDAGVDNYIKMSDEWGAGSGKGDMLVFVPDSLFTNADNYSESGDNFIYLYSGFGYTIDGADGFEEWAIGVGGPII
ncbi:MAG: hypothetical protein ACYSSL_04485, partial [Planctomycetota bacterium]